MDMIRVGIIVPIYNAAKYLREALDSICAQTYKEWACVLVDDCSTDNSRAICEEYTQKDKRFILLSLPQNTGSADFARSKALDMMPDVQFISNIDADDAVEADYIERLVARQVQTNSDIVCPRMIGCEDGLKGESYRLPLDEFDMTQIMDGKKACRLTLANWEIGCNGMLTKRELYEGVVRGGWLNSDEFTSRQLLFKASVVSFEDTHYLYRSNTDSTSRYFSIRMLGRTHVSKQIANFVKENYGGELYDYIVIENFFDSVRIVYLSYKNYFRFSKEERHRITENLKRAYEELKENDLSRIIPKHNKLFCERGYGWFVAASCVWGVVKKVKFV